MPTPGPLELVAVLVIALIVLGPGKLPDVGTALGKSIREFRKASSDIQDAVRFDATPLAQAPVHYAAAATLAPVPTVQPAFAVASAPAQPVAATSQASGAATSSTAEPAR